MDFLQYEFLGNEVQDWLIAVGIAFAVAVVLRYVVHSILRALGRWSQRTESPIDDLLIELGGKTKKTFYLAVGLYVGSRPLDLPLLIWDGFEKFLVIAVLFQIGIWASTAAGGAIRIFQKDKYGDDTSAVTTFKLLDGVVTVTIWVVVLLLALANVGVDVTALVTGLGIGGIAVALAVQSVLADMLASLSIIFDKPFVVGDYVVLGEYMGTVETIGMKTTHIRSISGEQIVVSNSDLLQSRIRNYGRMAERRGDFRLGVVYETPQDKVARIPGILQEAIEARTNTRFDRSHFSDFGDFSLNFDTVYFMLVPDYKAFKDTQEAINLYIMRRFEEENIVFAYPTQQLYVSAASEEGETGAASVDGA